MQYHSPHSDPELDGSLSDHDSAHDHPTDGHNALTSQTLNADGTPKRPMNAFMIFARRRRPQVSAENQSMRTGDISKILSQEWKAMAPSDKSFYLAQAKQLKETFNSKYPDYVYRRRPNNTRKKRSTASPHSSSHSPHPPYANGHATDGESSPDAETPPPLPASAPPYSSYSTSHPSMYGASHHGNGYPSNGQGYGPYGGGGHHRAHSATYPYPHYESPRGLAGNGAVYYPPYDANANAASSSSMGSPHLGLKKPAPAQGQRTPRPRATPPYTSSSSPHPHPSAHSHSNSSSTSAASASPVPAYSPTPVPAYSCSSSGVPPRAPGRVPVERVPAYGVRQRPARAVKWRRGAWAGWGRTAWGWVGGSLGLTGLVGAGVGRNMGGGYWRGDKMM
ncbi:HMG box domain-containing protein [Mycena sanguinolenta]|uniref:HMG box domain-containing protein n=1 Tax=Mycena sanguinolenta TaxID=230812 RepID=A0A8H7DL18_9AGAR|nr:HMG box domain-containing protein [Mycena sanguinolenta]